MPRTLATKGFHYAKLNATSKSKINVDTQLRTLNFRLVFQSASGTQIPALAILKRVVVQSSCLAGKRRAIGSLPYRPAPMPDGPVATMVGRGLRPRRLPGRATEGRRARESAPPAERTQQCAWGQTPRQGSCKRRCTTVTSPTALVRCLAVCLTKPVRHPRSHSRRGEENWQ